MNNLDRFITAQKKDYDKALKEIQNEKNLLIGHGIYFHNLKVWIQVLWLNIMELKVLQKLYYI